jgi:hypothetical protein
MDKNTRNLGEQWKETSNYIREILRGLLFRFCDFRINFLFYALIINRIKNLNLSANFEKFVKKI